MILIRVFCRWLRMFKCPPYPSLVIPVMIMIPTALVAFAHTQTQKTHHNCTSTGDVEYERKGTRTEHSHCPSNMDGILDHGKSPEPATKGEARAQQATLLSTRRQAQQIIARKAQLLEEIRRTEELIEEERSRKRELAAQSRDLRQQMGRLAALAPELAKEKERQAAHVRRRDEHTERRREPLSKNPNEGMLTFQRIGCEKYPPERVGPSSGRTGFVTDYKGRMYLSGMGERKSESQMYKLAQTEVERRRSVARRAKEAEAEEAEALRLAGGGGPSPALAAGSPLLSTSASAPSLPLLRSCKRVIDTSHLSKGTVYGKPSHVDLEKYKHLSSKRSRYYTDYEGRRIAMDPSDWPTTDGLMLL